MNQNSQTCSLHLSPEEASAVLSLASSPEWQVLSKHLERRLELLRDELETESGEKYLRTQGRCEELRAMLELPARSERVLDGVRTRR